MSKHPPEFVTPPPVSSDQPQFYSGPLAVPHQPRVPKIWKAMEFLGGLGIIVSVVVTFASLLAVVNATSEENSYSFLAAGGFITFLASCLIYTIGRGMAWWQSS